MVVQGPRTYTLVKVVSDAGLYGIGEAYGSPGAGVKEQIHVLKSEIIGKDPLQIDTIYTGLGQRTDGSAHSLMRGVSGIEMALWDLAGKIVGLPVSTLLGGRFRDKVRGLRPCRTQKHARPGIVPGMGAEGEGDPARVQTPQVQHDHAHRRPQGPMPRSVEPDPHPPPNCPAFGRAGRTAARRSASIMT